MQILSFMLEQTIVSLTLSQQIYFIFTLLFVGDCEGGTLAYAFACLHDDNNNRPLAGYTNICPAVCCF